MGYGMFGGAMPGSLGPLVFPRSTAPADFWVALARWFAADPALTRAFPGGLGQGPVGASTPLPYARVGQTDLISGVTPDDSEEEAVFSCYAGTDDAAKAASDLLAARLDASPSREPLAYSIWTESGHRPVRTSQPVFANYVGDGQAVWECSFAFRFWVVRAAPGPALPW